MRSALIVGAGQLGSRHLQGLALSKTIQSITVIDPSRDSLDLAKERWGEVDPGHMDIHWSHQLAPGEVFDIGIFAMTAGHRKQAILETLGDITCPNLILEKFLFNTISDFEEIQRFFEFRNIKAWVNCPRRTASGYQVLKDRMSEQGQISYSVQGGPFGLGSNSIHFLDIFSFFIKDTKLEISMKLSEKTLSNSKRPGIKEFKGQISALSERGDLFSVSSICSDNPYVVEVVTTDVYTAIIDQKDNAIRFKLHTDSSWSDIPIDQLNQSELTGALVDEIIETGVSRLTPYNESAELHLQLLKAFIKHFNLPGPVGDPFPIT